MARRRLFFFLLLFFLLSGISGIGASARYEQRDPLTPVVSIIDSRGAMITLSSVPASIVSLSPNVTEILFALGIGDRVAGRTDYCDHPPEAKRVESMGDLFSPSIEKIIATGADLVIISNLGQMQTIEAIERAGVPVAYIDEPGTMAGTFRIIELIGELTGTSERAIEMIGQMSREIAEVQASIAGRRKPTAYYVAGFGEWGDFTATGDTYLHDIITFAGAENIAGNAVNWSYQLELLLAQDPEIIILPPMWGSTFEKTKQEFTNHPSYKNLHAVTSGNIISIESNLMERQGPRSAEAVRQLAQLIEAVTR